jgi:FKBP-type peptidyl-prolyl cis-trans isomerase
MKVSKFAAMGLGLFACTALALAQDPKAPAAGAGTQTQPATRPAAGAGAAGAAAPAGAQKPAAGPAGDLTKQASYAIGLSFGQNFKEQGLGLDLDQVVAGLRDGLSDAQPKMTEEECQTVLIEFQKAVFEGQKAKNLAEATAFFAANKGKPGVQATKSGLQYQVLKAGTGANPKLTDVVKVNYKGTLLDGTVFDSSYDSGSPIEFPLGQVIKGWQEGIQLAKVGGQIRLFVPPALAYGEIGSPPAIPPNSALIFDVELLDTRPAPASPTPGSPPPNAGTPKGGSPE